jgi:acetyl esterase/lipase
MKTLKLTVTVFLSVIFVSTTLAQGRLERRDSLLEKWVQKKRDERNVESIAGDVTSKFDVPYLDDQDAHHRLDVYIPAKKDKPFAVLVHIHGGGWEIGDKSLMKTTGLFYASQSVLFITPNYRLSPKALHPAHVEDCAAAVAWAFRHAEEMGGDKKRIFLSGHSAGAHLAALLATDAAYLQKHGFSPTDLACVIPVDAASYDLTDSANERLVKKFIRDSFGSDQAILKSASPFCQVAGTKRYPSFLILNTMNREAAANGAKRFANKLREAGCDVRFVPVEDHTHAEMASGMYNLSDPVGRAIFQTLFPQQKK